MDRGERRPWNVRLAHVLCNNMDFGWPTRIRSMLQKDPTLSFEKIAEALNMKKRVHVPPDAESWTAEIVAQGVRLVRRGKGRRCRGVFPVLPVQQFSGASRACWFGGMVLAEQDECAVAERRYFSAESMAKVGQMKGGVAGPAATSDRVDGEDDGGQSPPRGVTRPSPAVRREARRINAECDPIKARMSSAASTHVER